MRNVFNMTREEMIKKVLAIKYPKKEKDVIYEIANELGLKLKKTECGRCLRDYVALLKEELGLIKSAAEESEFNSNSETYSGPLGTENFTTNEPNDEGWVYIGKRTQTWNGHLINNNTPTHVIEEFVKRFPKGYYIKVQTNKNNNE